MEEDKEVEPSSGNAQTEAQTLKITVVQTNSQKAQADVFEHFNINKGPFEGLETRTDLKNKMQR